MLSIIVFLVVFTASAILSHCNGAFLQKHNVFPYVVAGDPKLVLPEPSLHAEEAAPPALPNIPALEETIGQILKEAQQDRTQRAAALKAAQLEAALRMGPLVSGPTAQVYIDAGAAGVAAAAAQTSDQRFGPAVGRAVRIVSFLNFVPFLWFCLAGGSQQLFRSFVATTASYGLHDLCLAWLMNCYVWDGAFVPLLLAFFCAMAGLLSGLYMTTKTWKFAVFWFNFNILLFVRGFPVLGPYAWVGVMPSLSPVTSFYVFLTIASVLLSIGLLRFSTEENHATINAMVTGVVSSFGALSGFSCFFELSGRPAPYDFMKLLSIPCTIDFTNPTTLELTTVLLVLLAVSVWTNRLRYKQFGFVPEDEAARSLLISGRKIEDVD